MQLSHTPGQHVRHDATFLLDATICGHRYLQTRRCIDMTTSLLQRLSSTTLHSSYGDPAGDPEAYQGFRPRFFSLPLKVDRQILATDSVYFGFYLSRHFSRAPYLRAPVRRSPSSWSCDRQRRTNIPEGCILFR